MLSIVLSIVLFIVLFMGASCFARRQWTPAVCAKIRYCCAMADHFRTGFDWEDARFFAALARHGSLSATARALGVNHATVARRVAAMEQALGEKLFERRPDGYALTPAGARALEAADAMEKAARRLAGAAAEQPVGGLVRISAVPSLADLFLVPRLAALAETHPAIDIEIAADRRVVSLARHETDIALRLGSPGDGDVIARRMARVAFGYYAAPAWAQRLAAGAAPVFVGFDEANAHLPQAGFLARQFPRARLALRANTQATQALAARAGLGIALLPHFIGAADGALVPVKLGAVAPARDLFLVSNPLSADDRAVRTVRDFLAALFHAEAALFSGPDD
ncbi:LysR family transcriptional regulator [Xanthobacter autotrophicus]|uniref:LysR family transcriptional regulator n=1 Tax=Xanthobacter TaxID=279 RepID=UPI0024AB5674|nr:LysR family transcriptional regulator [Xanthobacter autotrophicus]MDI4663189.1 LysR family transcriptional regulator [Xanthobacter autotrophicus]